MRTILFTGIILLAASMTAFAERPATIYTVDDQKLMVKMLDESFVMRTAYGLVTVPAGDVKAIWPGGKGRGPDVLATKGGDFRGTFEIPGVRTEGTLGKVTLQLADIRVVQFEAGEATPPEAVPSYGPMKGKEPEVELMAADETRVTGTLEAAGVEIDTGYGKLTVPAKELISVTLGKPDEVVARSGTLRGAVNAEALSVKTRFGSVKVVRGNVVKLTVILRDAAAETPPPAPGPTPKPPGKPVFKTGQWTEIFNGQSLKGWEAWDGKEKQVEDGCIHCLPLPGGGSDGLGYADAPPMTNMSLKVSAKMTRVGHTMGFELVVRCTNTGNFHLIVGRHDGYIARWSNATMKATVLKRWTRETTADEWHTIEFALSGNRLTAAVDGTKVAEADADEELPPGGVCVASAACDVLFRSVEVKPLK